MNGAQRPTLTDDDQRLLDGVQVRLVRPDERARFDKSLREQHYLKSADLVGEQVRYVAEDQGQWVALLCWCAGAYHLKARETWIGWTAPQKKRRLPLAVNNSRFLILEGWHVPNLASRVLKLCLQRLSQDWTDLYGHAVLVAESFVDPQQFLGTCYKASGWTLLGHTQGHRRVRQDFHLPHDRPKQLWVRELRPGARTVLRGRNLPEPLARRCRRPSPRMSADARRTRPHGRVLCGPVGLAQTPPRLPAPQSGRRQPGRDALWRLPGPARPSRLRGRSDRRSDGRPALPPRLVVPPPPLPPAG